MNALFHTRLFSTYLALGAVCVSGNVHAQSFRFAPQSGDVQQIAAWVVPGKYDCFGNQSVTVTVRADHPGYVDLSHKGSTHHMLPVASNTGAVRLESKTGGVFWLQLPAKSMLFSNKGSRIADDCHNHAVQRVVPPIGDTLQIQVTDLAIAPPPPPPTEAEQKQMTE